MAYRYLPANDEEQVIVEKYFPAIKIEGNKGDELTIHYLGICLADDSEPILYEMIKSYSVKEKFGKTYLIIEGRTGDKKKIRISGFQASVEKIVNVFNNYYMRHLAAREHQEAKQVEE